MHLFQEQTARLAMAVECGDMEGVRNNLYFKTEHPDSFHTCLVQCRPKVNQATGAHFIVKTASTPAWLNAGQR